MKTGQPVVVDNKGGANGIFAVQAPDPIVRKMNAWVRDAVRSPEMQEQLRGVGAESGDNTPEELRGFVEGEIEKWSAVIDEAGIQKQ